MADLLGVAVLGAGHMGADHVRRLDRVVSGARVAAVADPDVARAKEAVAGIDAVTVHADASAALDAPGVDAVLIASPGPAHEEALLAAFARDLPVLCEKPMVPEPAGALRVMEAELRRGRRLAQIGFMRRYDAGYRRLKALLDDGGLGRPLMLHCVHRNVSSPPGFTSAMLIDSSVSHEIDAARWLLGQELTAVTVMRPRASAGAPRGCWTRSSCCSRPKAAPWWTWRSSSTAASGTRCAARPCARRARRASATTTGCSSRRAVPRGATCPWTIWCGSRTPTTARCRPGSTRPGGARSPARASGTVTRPPSSPRRGSGRWRAARAPPSNSPAPGPVRGDRPLTARGPQTLPRRACRPRSTAAVTSSRPAATTA